MTFGYIASLFISTDRMPFLAPTPDNADPHFELVIAPGFYPHHVEVVDQAQLVIVYKQMGGIKPKTGVTPETGSCRAHENAISLSLIKKKNYSVALIIFEVNIVTY